MTKGNKVYVKRTFDCDAKTLFSWLTAPERITQWFGPANFRVAHAESDFRIGGSYRISLEKDGKYQFTVTGEYLEIDPPWKVTFSYKYTDLEGRPESNVQFLLEEISPMKTALSLVQRFEAPTPDFATRTQAWNYMMEKLDELVMV